MKNGFHYYASIALPLPLTTTFTYSIPPEMSESAEFGRRAQVPFGKRILTGFIVDILTNPGDVPPEKLKPIIEILDDAPVFDAHMLELAQWVAGYYLSSVGEVLRTAMPTGTMVQSRIRIHFVAHPEEKGIRLTPRQQSLLDIIAEHSGILMRKLERSSSLPAANIVRTLERKGLVRLEREIRQSSVRPKTMRLVKPADKSPVEIPSRAHKQKACRETLNKYPEGIPWASPGRNCSNDTGTRRA